MLRRVPKDLPLFGALALGLSLLAFGYAGIYAHLWFGRPSSTVGLAFLFIPIWGLVATLVGLVLGFAIRAIWRRARAPAAPEKRTWVLAAMLGGLVVASAGAGVLEVIWTEEQAKPGIRADSGLLLREFRADSHMPVRTPTTLYESNRGAAGLSWGSNRSELRFADNRVEFRDAITGKSVEIRTEVLDYVTRVDAIPLVRKSNSPPLLAVVISGRATGRRAVIAVIDQDYKTVFEEQLVRFWELKQTPIEVRADPTPANEYIVVGPGCERSVILRPKHAT